MNNKRISRIISEALEMEIKRFTSEGLETYRILEKFQSTYLRSHKGRPYYMIRTSVDYPRRLITFVLRTETNTYTASIAFTDCEVEIEKYAKNNAYTRSVKFGDECYTSDNYDAKSVCDRLIKEFEDIRINGKDVPEESAETVLNRIHTEDAKYNKLSTMVYLIIRTAAKSFPQITDIRERLGLLHCKINHLDEDGDSNLIPVSFFYTKFGILEVRMNSVSYKFNFNTLGNPYQFFIELFQELIDKA